MRDWIKPLALTVAYCGAVAALCWLAVGQPPTANSCAARHNVVLCEIRP